MSSINIRWFAAYRDATGATRETVETEAATAAELFAEMSIRHPALAQFSRALVAINDEMSDWNAHLQAGDEVLFFPPVAGG